MPDIKLIYSEYIMETIIIIIIVALVFGASVKNLIDRLLGTVDKSLDLADTYIDGARKEQAQATKLKLEETKVKHADRLARINAKRVEKGLPPVQAKDLGLDDI